MACTVSKHELKLNNKMYCFGGVYPSASIPILLYYSVVIFFYIPYSPYASFLTTAHYHRMATVRISQRQTVVRRHYASHCRDRTILGVISFFTHYAVDTSCLVIHSPCRF